MEGCAVDAAPDAGVLPEGSAIITVCAVDAALEASTLTEGAATGNCSQGHSSSVPRLIQVPLFRILCEWIFAQVIIDLKTTLHTAMWTVSSIPSGVY